MGALLVRHEPTSVAVVRREIAVDLVAHGVEQDRIDDITLVASELVGNAVRHAELSSDGELDVAWTVRPDEVMLSVADCSEAEPRRRIVATDEPSGRGLAIVDVLSSSWGVEPVRGGKRVWARVPLIR
jgi:anti-sigma regulatory factor (Ser/Thr protein kinase)